MSLNNNNDKTEYINKIKLHPVNILDGVEEIRQDFEERLECGDTTYGIEILDDFVQTIRRGSITFILARPNCGKSLMGQRIAVHLAQQGRKVLICSCEMGAGLLMERQLLNLTGVKSYELKDMYEHHRDMANKIMDSVIYDDRYNYLRNIDICETGGATCEDIMKMLDCFDEYDYIVIDYIQRIRGAGTEYEVITNASREFQTYARKTRKSLIVCSQAKRPATANSKQAPNTDGGSLGKGSGSIEEDGDVGLLLSEIEEEGSQYILATLFKNRFGSKNITYKYYLDGRLNFNLVRKSE